MMSWGLCWHHITVCVCVYYQSAQSRLWSLECVLCWLIIVLLHAVCVWEKEMCVDLFYAMSAVLINILLLSFKPHMELFSYIFCKKAAAFVLNCVVCIYRSHCICWSVWAGECTYLWMWPLCERVCVWRGGHVMFTRQMSVMNW